MDKTDNRFEPAFGMAVGISAILISIVGLTYGLLRTSPVPLPVTYFLIQAGIGLMGIIFVRRAFRGKRRLKARLEAAQGSASAPLE